MAPLMKRRKTVFEGVLRERRTKASAAATTHLRITLNRIAVVKEKGFVVAKGMVYIYIYIVNACSKYSLCALGVV